MDAKKIARTLYTFLFMLGLAGNTLAAEHINLQLRGPHQAQFIGYYVASAKGFYQAQGLNVEIRAAETSATAWREVIEGRADYAIDNSNAFTAFTQGQPLVALAAIAQQSPVVFIARHRDDLQSVDDFRFHNVMMFPGGQDPELLALLRSYNVALTDLNLFPATAKLQDLIDGKVDVYNASQINEPYQLTQLGVPFRVFDPHEKGIHFYSDLLLTHRKQVLDTPHQVEQFRKASLQGWHYALNHPEEALALMEELIEHYQENRVEETQEQQFTEYFFNEVMPPETYGELTQYVRQNYDQSFIDEFNNSLDNGQYEHFMTMVKNIIERIQATEQ